jgi:hypothetical protein
MLKIQEFILANGLEAAIKKFNLKTRIYDKKILLKYDQLSSPTLMALPEVQECRGLILQKDTWKVLSLAFTKFFNSEEGNAVKIDWDTAHVLEKLDGSCMQVYYDFDKSTWFAGTTGTAEGEGEVNNKLGTTFNDLFWHTITKVTGDVEAFKKALKKGHTYVFELTTPYNIVVKPHGESSASLLMVRNNETLAEYQYDDLKAIAVTLNVPLVKSYDLNAKDVGVLLRSLEGLPWSEEGYVVVDGKFNRVKIKNPAYVAVHHLKGKSAEHNILVIVKSNEIEEFGATFPERKEELYKLKENYDALIVKLNGVWAELETMKPKNIMPAEKKKYAQAVFEICTKNDLKTFTGLYFGLADGKVASVEDFMFNYDDKVLYKML